ncbi:hypothetical protein BT69DRAFT_1068301 [Atractiella rhizophila]|nr:hypothetical protein BT69DRAFT_1068301 [Atractiella rhizophila]
MNHYTAAACRRPDTTSPDIGNHYPHYAHHNVAPAPMYHVGDPHSQFKRFSTGHDDATTRVEWELATQKNSIEELKKEQLAIKKELNDVGGDLKLVLELVKSLKTPSRVLEPTPPVTGCLFQFSINRTELVSIIISFNPAALKAVDHFKRLIQQKKYVGARLFTAVDTDTVARCYFEDPTHQLWAEDELLDEPEEQKFDRNRGKVYLVSIRGRLRGNDFYIPLVNSNTKCSRVLVGEVKSGLHYMDMFRDRIKRDAFYVVDTQLC